MIFESTVRQSASMTMQFMVTVHIDTNISLEKITFPSLSFIVKLGHCFNTYSQEVLRNVCYIKGDHWI